MSNITRSLHVLHAPDDSTTAAENPRLWRGPSREYRLLLIPIIPANRSISRNWKCFKCEGGGLVRSSNSRRSHACASDASKPAKKFAAKPDYGSLGSVAVQSRSTRSYSPHENTEQNVFNVVPDVYKIGEAHPRLDGCDDLHLHQERAMKHSSNSCNINPAELPFSGRALDSTDSYRKFSGTSKSLKESLMSNQSHALDLDHTEIPNTPTQRSSQLTIPSPLLNLHGSAAEEESLPVYSILHVEPTTPERVTFGTVLCTVCHKQRLLAKSGNTTPVWYVFASILIHKV
jgi:hypothetical protein